MEKKKIICLLILICFLCSPVAAAQTEGKTQGTIGFSQGTHEEEQQPIRLPQTSEQQQSFQLAGLVMLILSVTGGYCQLRKS
ncbi:LPXTG cell wall anchor domain-containing protein [uncultured Vagococcus sp.]|uniref:LPXTG cell wall anchor domain-containing protein n=1 Tax=uncultured Vagococcus sp. TaxID=189676 RepID=UPI0028D3D025|nr:LPXTG cell wall anchor domain-containing protein [uncultured Vagococcus sp.]